MASRAATHIDIPTKEDWKALLEKAQGPFIALLMPSYRAGQEQQQNPVRFRNLLREVDSHAHGSGGSTEKIAPIVETLRGILDDREFWQHQGDGLAVFAAPGFLRPIRLPFTVDERVSVSARVFFVKPIVPLIQGSAHRFHVLALSQNAVRLLEATPWSIRTLPIPKAPENLTEALRYDDIQKHDHFYPGSQGRQRGGISPTPGHGLGVGDEKHQPKDEIVRYCQQVDAGLLQALSDPHVPLVLAGVEYLVAIYREVSAHPAIAERVILGNPEPLDDEDLRAKAWEITQPLFQQGVLQAADQYGQLAGGRRASNRLAEIVPAAYEGRVAVLFADPRAEIPGTFDPTAARLEVHAERRADDDDLVNLAVVQTFLHGGSVDLLEPDGRPLGPGVGPLAAVYRY